MREDDWAQAKDTPLPVRCHIWVVKPMMVEGSCEAIKREDWPAIWQRIQGVILEAVEHWVMQEDIGGA